MISVRLSERGFLFYPQTLSVASNETFGSITVCYHSWIYRCSAKGHDLSSAPAGTTASGQTRRERDFPTRLPTETMMESDSVDADRSP